MDQRLYQTRAGDLQVLPIVGENLCLSREGRTLLDSVTLTVGHGGGATVIIGPNGAGKSLLIRVLAGLVVPESGQVRWAGTPPDRARARRIGFVLQRPVLLRRTTIDNLVYVLKLAGREDAVARAIARQRLEDDGLAHLAQTNAQRLSGGEQQRLALSRALILEPDVLFLDEPSANLDPASVASIERQLNLEIERGLRVVFVTHDLAQARRLADDVMFVHNGRIVEQGDAADFFQKPISPQARAFIAGDLVL